MNILPTRKEEDLSHCRKNLFAIIILTLLILLTYSNTFHSSWHFDDKPNILTRKELHLSNLTWQEITKAFYKGSDRLYRPVSCLSFALNYYLGQENTFGYHVVNTLIHIVASIFLYLSIYYTLNSPRLKGKYTLNRYSIALMAAILWAINPIQTQAVTYVVQRMASMAGMFYIISLFFYIKGRTTEKYRHRIVFFILCIIAAVMAVGSKENALMIPGSIFILEIIFFSSLYEGAKTKRFIIWTIVLLLSLLICLLFIMMMGGKSSLFSGYDNRVFTLTERVLSEPRIILFYISLIFYPMPTRLSLEHHIDVSKSLIDPFSTFTSCILILLLVISALFLIRRCHFISFSILFFFLNHVIESTVLPLELIFEHRNYIPSMFLFVPVAMLLIYGMHHPHLKRSIKVMVILFVICIIVAFGHGTYIRNAIWKTEESLRINAMEMAPEQHRPWHNLALCYDTDQKESQKVLTLYRIALDKESAVNKDDKKLTHYNIGRIYEKMGENDTAVFHYLQALELDPDLIPALNNLGVLYSKNGQDKEAKKLWEKATTKNQIRFSGPFINLGRFYLKHGDIGGAIQALTRATTIDPNSSEALKTLASAYRQNDQLGKAHFLYQKALAANPKDLSIFLYLAEIYQEKGMKLKKEEAMERFVRLLPEKDLEKLVKDQGSSVDHQGGFLIEKKVVLGLVVEALQKRSAILLDRTENLEKLQQLLP